MSIQLPAPVQESAWTDLNLIDLPANARYHSDEEIDAMSKSMAIKQLMPIIVCKNGDRYEVVAGVCRALAARKDAWRQIKADVYEGLTPFQKLMITYTENEDRKDASPLYQAQVLTGMMDAENLTQEQLADRMGKTQQSISQYTVLSQLSPEILKNTNRFVKLGLKHFIQLLRIKNADAQWKLAEITADQGLSVDALQALVDKQLGVKRGAKVGRPKGDNNLDASGFGFTRKGSQIRIKTSFDETGDWEAWLPKLTNAFQSWKAAHPAKVKSPRPETVPAHEPKVEEKTLEPASA